MNQKIKNRLIDMAIENPGVSGKFKLAAGLVYRNRLIATGVNSYKTHPVMMNGAYKEEQIYLHAEADAVVRAAREYGQEFLSSCSLYVVRVKKSIGPAWELGYAKPCKGCMSVLYSYGIDRIEYTLDGEIK